MPQSYSFTGDVITFIGMVGVLSTIVITVTSFRRYFNSPLRK